MNAMTELPAPINFTDAAANKKLRADLIMTSRTPTEAPCFRHRWRLLRLSVRLHLR